MIKTFQELDQKWSEFVNNRNSDVKQHPAIGIENKIELLRFDLDASIALLGNIITLLSKKENE